MDSTSSQQFCVRWNSHLGSLGAAFPQLLAGQRFVDVTLACEGHQLHCHRLVLAACSTYFESLLDENPCKHPIIILPRDIKLWEIQALVDFMYKGEVNVSQAGLSDLLKCAEILQIRGLCGSDAALNLNQVNSTTTTTATTTAAAATTSSAVSTTQNESQTAVTPNPSLSLATQSSSIIDRSETIEPTSPTRKRHHQQSKQNKSTGGGGGGGSSGTATSQLSVSQNSASSSSGTAGNVNSTKKRALSVAQQRDNIVLFNKVKSELQHSPYRTSTPNRTVSKIEPIEVSLDDEVIDDDDDSINPSNEKTAHVSDDSFSGKYLDYLEGAKSEFPLANVICEYDSGALQMDNMPGRRVRRSEATLRQAAECVSRGQTFQTVSDLFNIPISTIRFFMARKGILPRRKRGRSAGVSIGSGSQNTSSNDAHSTSNDRGTHSRSASPLEPPFHFANYKLPELKPKLL